MRLTIGILLIVSFNSIASGVYSQSAKVTVKMEGALIKEVLNKIEEISEFYFVYNNKLIDVEVYVDIDVEDEQIKTILDRIFNKQEVDYVLLDKQIILSPRNMEKPPTQQRRIIVKGKVIDSSGDPIPGVNVYEKSSPQNGVVTNTFGEYSIDMDNSEGVLVFSFIGFQTQDNQVKNRTEINVTLNEEFVGLDEVVAIGYGTQRKSSVTGSLSSVKAEVFENRVVANIDQALVGQMSGIRVQESSGVPGADASITIRGVNSINSSTSPLVLIDGVEGDMNSVNPNDIKSIDVLKDVSSAAIYGSRGANGVILITTKTGTKDGKQRIAFESSFGLQKAERLYDMMDKQGYYDYVYRRADALWSDGGRRDPTVPIEDRGDKYRPADFIRNTPYEDLPNTDWQGMMFDVAPIQNYQMSIMGNSDKSSYYVSGRYLDQEGILINTFAKRYNFTAKVDTDISEWLKAGANIAPSFGVEANRGADGKQKTLQNAMFYNPLLEANSNTQETGYTPLVPANSVNPYLQQKNKVDEMRWSKLRVSSYLELSPIKNMTIKTQLSLGTHDGNDKFWESSNYTRGNPRGDYNTQKTQNFQIENTFSYAKKIKKHSLNVLLGQSAQDVYIWTSGQSSLGYPNDEVYTLNVATEFIRSTTEEIALRRTSYFGRLQYDFKSKYLATFNARKDGSSRFGPNTKWGFFPSASVGWILSKESFLKDVEQLNLLKLRVSYGRAGNDGIGDYRWISTMESKRYNSTGNITSTSDYLNTNGLVLNGYSQANYTNPNLSWETTTSFNLGMDVWAFNNRLQFVVDYYDNITSDLLLNTPLPQQTGFSTSWRNYGEVRNYGVETEVSGYILSQPKFKWNSNFNVSYNRNEVLEIPEPFNADRYGVYARLEEGQGIFDFYMYQWEGLLSQEDLDNGYDVPGSLPGGLKYKVDENGQLTDEMREWSGSPVPRFIYGWTNSFNIHNFDLSFLFTAQTGGKVLFMLGRQMDSGSEFNQLANWENNWQSPEEPGDGRTPAFGSAMKNWSTHQLFDSDYIKLKSVVVGYGLPKSISQKIGIANARIYASAENLFTIFGDSNYPGVMTESADSNSSAINKAVDYTTYPPATIINLGVKLEF